MLLNLHVKNLALIDETEVEFGQGLNILTGETGAGKSIIIGSINLALGSKADSDLIRKGCDYALIELLFESEDPAVRAYMDALDLPYEDGQILITRKIAPGRSTCKVNGETITARDLRGLAGLLIGIHGQQEHHTLVLPEKQCELLDRYTGNGIREIQEELAGVLSKLRKAQRELAEKDLDEATRKREADLAEYEIREIEEAELTEGEDETLEAEYRLSVSGQKVREAVGLSLALSGYDEAEGAGNLIARALRELRTVSGLDEELRSLEEALTDVDGILSDLGRRMSRYLEGLEFDPQRLAEVEDRLNRINRLKDKYGGSISDILAYAAKRQEELERYADHDAWASRMREEIEQLRNKALELCGKISALRNDAAKKLSEEMMSSLEDLNFFQARFSILVEPDPEHMTQTGYDHIVYRISTNPGEPLEDLAKVASGGELSRIMLALLTILADKDSIDTLIFDEIDTGISGNTAWKVAEKMAILGKRHQIVCITHLAQIAAMADIHFLIEKQVSEGRTVTGLSMLSETETIEDLARMLSGGEISDTARENAGELRKRAVAAKG